MVSNRQTISFLRKRFEEAGIEPANKHGQNFLIDLNLVELLVRAADIRREDVVLEVGTGTGSLTAMMASKAAHVVTVEIDPRMFQLASEELIDVPNVTMLHQDALKNKNTLSPVLLEAVRQQVEAEPDRRLKLVANLPYNIATPIVSNLLSTPIVPASMTVTIQKELAERIVAAPSTKDYSALSVWVQSLCFAHIVRIMPPSVFWPRPRVDSAIIQIIPDADRRGRIPDLDFWHKFVRGLFLHRRKYLRGVLVALFKKRLDKPQIDEIMQQQGLGPTSRAEELQVETMLALGEVFRRILPDETETDVTVEEEEKELDSGETP